MKTEPTRNILHNLNQSINSHIETAVRDFQNLTEADLLKPSEGGGWSIAQCLDHLNSYGDYYLPEIQKSLSKGKGKSEQYFSSGWLGAYFTRMMQPSAKKYKAVKGHTPTRDLDARRVVALFIDQQEQLLKYLGEAEQTSLNTRVPLSIGPIIKLKLGDIFQFIVVHDERHIRQALRNISLN